MAVALGGFLPQVSSARRDNRRLRLVPDDIRHGSEQMQALLTITTPVDRVQFEVNAIQQGTFDWWTSDLSGPRRRLIRYSYGDSLTDRDAAPLAVFYSTDRAGFRLPQRTPAKLHKDQSLAHREALSQRTVNFRDVIAQYLAVLAVDKDRQEFGENPAFLGERVVEAATKALAQFLNDGDRPQNFQGLEFQNAPYRLLVSLRGKKVGLHQLSDGERNLVALVLDLTRRLALANPGLDDPLRGSAVVLIDELELHLHPNWQRSVVANLLKVFSGAQFICTTHSPFIIQSLKQGQLISLEGPIENLYENQGIEEAARFGLDVDSPEMSKRYAEMIQVADEYFEILESGEEDENLRLKVEEFTARYANDPAYEAMLRRVRSLHRGWDR